MQMKMACSGESMTGASRARDAVDVRALAKSEALRDMWELRDLVDEPFSFESGVEFDADEFASVALDAE